MANEKKLKHLELVQGVINRLSTNSFLLKGWTIFLVSAIFAVLAKDGQTAFVSLTYIPTIMFWGLDGFFLWQEQLYRKLYDHVRHKRDEDIDFSMNTNPFMGTGWMGLLSATCSKTLIAFHGVLILLVTTVIFITLKTTEG